jgi:membrane fusion protein, multidrug efflux system
MSALSSSRHPFHLALPAAALALLLAACGEPPQRPNMGAQGTPKVGVTVLQPQRVALSTELPGRTSPYLMAEVRPQVAGIVLMRGFREGSDVRAGDTLYQIDPSSYQASYDGAKASLSKAEATLRSATLKEARYKELVAIHAVSQQDADDSAAALAQAEADVASARAAMETARINMAHTRITTPISGRIGKSTVTAGALVTASQATALATVQQLDPIYVDVTQPSAAALRLKRAFAKGELTRSGDNAAHVTLLLEDGTPYPLAGRLQFSDVTVDPSTGAITLRAVFPNPKAELLPGMYVRAVLEEGIKEQALLVPQQAVTRDAAGKPLAYVVDSESKMQPRLLDTERAIGDQWLVTSGLQAGDRLVVDGAQRARPGAAVEAVPAGAAVAAATNTTTQVAPR